MREFKITNGADRAKARLLVIEALARHYVDAELMDAKAATLAAMQDCGKMGLKSILIKANNMLDVMKCDRCLEERPSNPKLTSESEPYCSHCGFIFGTCVAPSTWACDCGNVKVHHGGDDRPHCNVCEVPMNCWRAGVSPVHGVSTGVPELDLGLELLLEAEDGMMSLGSDMLTEILAGTNLVGGRQ